jgi:tetratricopeptide (TPR) repeat protein
MLAKKNRISGGAVLILALAVFVAGCSPAGTRALLKGKKYLDRGDYAGAVAEFKTATSLLPTNAPAFNYLGVACQRAGQPADAAKAYQHALVLDRDLIEAHYNLGCLWLEQNQLDAAKTEFTAYTLRRPNAVEGWIKLGVAQLHAGETVPAEKSFSTALALNTNNAEAYNGLGLARLLRERPREASEFFAAAIHFHPEFAPAYLNLAAVNQQYLHDPKSALQNYHAWLALQPHPANWDEVNAVAGALEKSLIVAAVAPPPPASETKTQATAVTHQPAPPKPVVLAHTEFNPPPTQPAPPAQVVQVQPEPTIVTTPAAPVMVPTPLQTATTSAELPLELPPAPAPEKKSGFLHNLNPTRWFGSSTPGKKYDENGVTPLPEPGSGGATKPAPAPAASPVLSSPRQNVSRPAPQPAVVVPSAPVTFSRYAYAAPRAPKTGNHAAAAGAFTQAQEFEQDSRWVEAMQAYQQAAQFDPAWFEAQYNYGMLSFRLRDYQQSLTAYETALAIQPDSADARYNFAQALKAAGYVPDAVNELKKVIAGHPGGVREARAHLALGNLYAQQLHDPAPAREHYLKVLELDPQNPQATDIRFWLAANPK